MLTAVANNSWFSFVRKVNPCQLFSSQIIKGKEIQNCSKIYFENRLKYEKYKDLQVEILYIYFDIIHFDYITEFVYYELNHLFSILLISIDFVRAFKNCFMALEDSLTVLR